MTQIKVLIVGYGFVGQAVETSLVGGHGEKASNFEIQILDTGKGLNPTPEFLKAMDAVFICVPSPESADCSCDDSIVQQYVELFAMQTAITVIRSSIPPSSVQKMVEINPAVIYMPEFLRESSWKCDALHPEHLIIGTNVYESFDILRNVFRKSALRNLENMRMVSPVQASLFKYSVNTFLATKVVFFHELNKWMEGAGHGELWPGLKEMLMKDERVGRSHLKAPGEHGYGFAGTCFPKDTKAFVAESGGELSLLADAIKCNTWLRSSV